MQDRRQFKLSEIANIDQTLISFEFLDCKTYALAGSKTVWVKTAQSRQDKRQATLQIVLHANGELRYKLLLIFHGKGDRKGKLTDSRLKKEYKRYNPRVVVAFNPKAYSNTNVIIEQIRSQYSHSLAYAFQKQEPKHEPRMLSLDVFKGQLNDDVLAEFKRINCTCSFIPSSTTSFIQVCDVAINKPLKNRIAELAEIYYDNHKEEQIKNKYSVSDRRVMLVQQVAQAQEDLHKYNSETIRQAFRDVGLALPIDGSQDSELKIKDLPSIQVGDWQSWLPTASGVQPSLSWIDDVITNQTAQEVEDQALDQDNEEIEASNECT